MSQQMDSRGRVLINADSTTAAKILGAGQLASSKGTLITATAAKWTTVTSITLVNTGAVALTVNLYLKKSGGSSRRILSNAMSMLAGAQYEIDTPYNLDAADLIEGDASSATTVDYTITGVERDQ